MKRDIKTIYIIALAYLVAIVVTLFVPNKLISNFSVTLATAAFAAVAFTFIKKRRVPDIHKREVTVVCFAAALLGVIVLYLLGLKFGFVRIALNASVTYIYLLPVAVTVFAGEILRRVLLSQNRKGVTVITYFAFVLLDIALFAEKNAFVSFTAFMSAFGFVGLPALASNLLYCSLSKNYGAISVVPYRAIVTLYQYIIPLRPSVPDALFAFLKIVFPLILLWFIISLYKKRVARVSRRSAVCQSVVAVVCAAVMLLCVSFVGGVFDRKMIVVGSESMSGALEKGDVIVYDKYDGEIVENGQIVLFDRNGTTVIHRVVDVKKINGVYRYYTKGDANEGSDSGYITSADLVGVVKLRIPFVGYPTVWLHDLFK